MPLNEYNSPTNEDYTDLNKVLQNKQAAKQFYSKLYDCFLCRCEWKYVHRRNGGGFFGFFAGYYHKAGVGPLHLRIENYLKGTPWRWRLAVEYTCENFSWTPTERRKKLQALFDEIKQYGINDEKMTQGSFNKEGPDGKAFYPFAELTAPKTFEAVCPKLQRIFKVLRVCAANGLYKNSLQ